MLCVMAAGLIYFNARFQIGFDFQEISSIPGQRLYVIDKWDQELIKGKRYAYWSKGLEPIFDDGSIMVKILVAEPGDKVEVDDNYQVLIDDKPTRYYGLAQAERVGYEPEEFVGSASLAEDEFWFMGTHELSFDSRYYGAISSTQVIGRAYPIL